MGSSSWSSKVYDFNGKVDNTYARSAVTWGLVIIPVYGITALVDFVALNLIEFWSGKNPATAASLAAATQVQVVERGADRYIQTVTQRPVNRPLGRPLGRRLGVETQIAHYRDGQLVNRLVVRQSADSPIVTGTLTWAGSGPESDRTESYTVRPTPAGAVVERTITNRPPGGTVMSRANPAEAQEIERLF